MKKVLIGLFFLAFGIAGYFSFGLFDSVHERKDKMEDYAEINMVNHELFNMQLWKDKALEIVKMKIRQFEFSEQMYEVLDDQIQSYAVTIHKQYIEQGELGDIILKEIKNSGKVNALFMKIIEQQVPEILGELDLKPQIPALSQQILTEIKKNEPLIKEYLQQELLRLVLDEETRTYTDRRTMLYRKYNVPDLEAADTYLSGEVGKLDKSINAQIIYLCLTMGFIILIAFYLGRQVGFKSMIAALTTASILLLVLGVTMPMIDIDARLNSFVFNLFDEPIEFNEQVIYYQSKSIVEVTKTLWQGGSWDLKLVGILVLLFSIVFPFFKLILSGLYLFLERIRSSKLAKGVIFHLGKWSMADVFVVAIFMAYIGFYGIISTQLNSISRNDGGFAIETINYSRLAPGAFFFTAYTILSICISILINRHDKSDATVINK